LANSTRIFIFHVGNILFGVPVEEVIQVARPTELTPFRKPPKNMLGTFVVRDKNIPLFDLPGYFGLARTGTSLNSVICDIRGQLVGFLADNLSGVASVPTNLPLLDKDVFKTKNPVRIAHVQNQLVQVLSLKNLIAPATITALKRVLTT